MFSKWCEVLNVSTTMANSEEEEVSKDKNRAQMSNNNKLQRFDLNGVYKLLCGIFLQHRDFCDNFQ